MDAKFLPETDREVAYFEVMKTLQNTIKEQENHITSLTMEAKRLGQALSLLSTKKDSDELVLKLFDKLLDKVGAY